MTKQVVTPCTEVQHGPLAIPLLAEVITSAGQSRGSIYANVDSRKLWTERVAAWKASRLRQREFCELESLPYKSFLGWPRALREQPASARSAKEAAARKEAKPAKKRRGRPARDLQKRIRLRMRRILPVTMREVAIAYEDEEDILIEQELEEYAMLWVNPAKHRSGPAPTSDDAWESPQEVA